VYTTYVWLLKN